MSILDRFRLDGKTVIVTGASSGLGTGFARAFAEAGADIVLSARRLDALHALEPDLIDLGARVLSVQTDVSRKEDCDRLIATAMAEFGRVDVLINNAGVGTAVPALAETEEEFRSVYDVNLFGVYWMAQAAARVMAPGSTIVNVSSIGAFVSFGRPQAAYISSKAAVVGLTRDLAQQWTGRKGIRVNAVAPGFVYTDLSAPTFDGHTPPQADITPAGRAGTVEEIAAAVIFLASDAASYVTGHTLVVDGGRTVF